MFGFLTALWVTMATNEVHEFKNNELEKNSGKIRSIRLFNNLLRWRRKSGGVNDLPDLVITPFIGEDYLHIEPFAVDLHGAANELAQVSEFADGNDIPMEVQAASEFYNHMTEMEKKYVKSTGVGGNKIKSGVCGEWRVLEEIVPDSKYIFSFFSDKANKKHGAYKIIKKHLKKAKNEKQLKKKLKKMKKEKVKKAMEAISEYMKKYLGSLWIGDPEEKCGKDLDAVRALLSVEDRLLSNAPDGDCGESAMLGNESGVSLKKALLDISAFVEDQELLSLVLPPEVLQETLLEVDEFTRRTPDRELGILSLSSVRELVLGSMAVQDCEGCDCRSQRKLTSLHNAIARVRQVIPAYTQCHERWSEVKKNVSDIVSEHGTVTDYLDNNKESFFSITANITQIDEVLDVLSTNLPAFYRKPYINLPFEEMPMKHGLWWIGLFLLPFEDCDQFAAAQLYRELLEIFSKLFYFTDGLVADRCGTTQHIDPEDSFVLADKMAGIVGYHIFEKYDYMEMDEVIMGSDSGNMTINKHETQLWIYYEQIREGTMDADEGSINDIVQMQLSAESFSETYTAQRAVNMMQYCPTCEFLYEYTPLLDYLRMQYLNYYEGRTLPFHYEQEIYKKARSEVVDEELLKGMGCNSSVEDQLTSYIASTESVLEANPMRAEGAFEAYMSYIKPVGQDITRKQMLASLEMVNSISDFQQSLFMRLFKTGIEEKDDRSVFDDYKEFEEEFIGKKQTKAFKAEWKNHILNRNCLLGYVGLTGSKDQIPIRETGKACDDWKMLINM